MSGWPIAAASPGLGQQQPDAQDAVLVAGADGGRRARSPAGPSPRRAGSLSSSHAATSAMQATQAITRLNTRPRYGLVVTTAARSGDPVPFTDAVRGHRPTGQADRRPLARRSRAVPCAVRRHRRPAARAVRRRRVAGSSSGAAGRRSPSSPSAATAAASWRRRATSTSCSSTTARPGGIDEVGHGAVVPAVGRRPEARPRRALARRAARPRRRRPRHGDGAAQRPHLAGDEELGARLATEGLARWRRNGRRWLDALRSRVIERRATGRRRRLPPRARPQGRPRRPARRPHPVVGRRRRPARAGRRPRRARRVLRRRSSTSASPCTASTGRPGDVLRLEDQDAVAAGVRRRRPPTR